MPSPEGSSRSRDQPASCRPLGITTITTWGSPTYLTTEGVTRLLGVGVAIDLHPVCDGHAAGLSEGAVGAWEPQGKMKSYLHGWVLEHLGVTAHQMASSPADESQPRRWGALILSSQLGVSGQPSVILEEAFQGEGDGGLYTEGYFGGVRPPQNTDGRMHAWGQTPRENIAPEAWPGSEDTSSFLELCAQRHAGV